MSTGQNGNQGNCWGAIRLSDDGTSVAFSSSSGLVAGDTNGQVDVFVRNLQLNAIERVSVSSAGVQGNGGSGGVDAIGVSGDGRFVVFVSNASNLVPGDTNVSEDVFCRDRLLAETTLVSVGAAGVFANGDSSWARCSADGRYVVFNSAASNLVSADTNGQYDTFLRDRLLGTTTRVSVDSSGAQGIGGPSYSPEISPDGTHVGYSSLASNLVASDSNNAYDVFLYDRLSGTTSRVSEGVAGTEADGSSYVSSLTLSGRMIAFDSVATNMVQNDTNGVRDVFVRMCSLVATYCTAKTNSLGCVPSISRNGYASVSWPEGFTITATLVLNQTSGTLIYSASGPLVTPFAGGTMCVGSPRRRTGMQQSGGSTSGMDCTGGLSFDFNQWLASGYDTALIAGTEVWAQYWSRDPGFAAPANASLTNAVDFLIGP